MLTCSCQGCEARCVRGPSRRPQHCSQRDLELALLLLVCLACTLLHLIPLLPARVLMLPQALLGLCCLVCRLNLLGVLPAILPPLLLTLLPTVQQLLGGWPSGSRRPSSLQMLGQRLALQDLSLQTT